MRLFNKNGSIAANILNCGYTQKYTQVKGRCELYKEHGIYHVRLIFAGCIGAWTAENGKTWETFVKLSEARSCFAQYCKQVDIGRVKLPLIVTH